MSEWVTLSSDRAATSLHSAVWLREGEIQASDANPVSPSSQDPSSPRRKGLVCVTCYSEPLTLPAAPEWKAENVSPKCLTLEAVHPDFINPGHVHFDLSSVACTKTVDRRPAGWIKVNGNTSVYLICWSVPLGLHSCWLDNFSTIAFINLHSRISCDALSRQNVYDSKVIKCCERV